MKITCTKAEAATRQLDEAIALLFADHDPLAIRTLAAAAHGILADLVEVKHPGSSWRTKLVEDSGLSKTEAIAVLNSAQNYLKHADRDPDAQLSFDEEENDHVIFFATLECGELGHRLSFSMQAFQIWYLASYPEKVGAETEPVKKSRTAFPDLQKLEREVRLAHGAEFTEGLRLQYESKLLSVAHSSRRTMKLYITEGSPYARIVRVVILEKGFESRIEIITAKTRAAGSPYYAINPSGRVPYLIRDDGPALEESQLIVAYLDQLDGKPMFSLPTGEPGWEACRLEALARSLMDGLAVWGREMGRPENERSPTIIKHEAARAARMAEVWEKAIDHPWMHGAPQSLINMAQITLACALGMEARNPDLSWRPGHPELCAWFDRIAARPSVAATAPPLLR